MLTLNELGGHAVPYCGCVLSWSKLMPALLTVYTHTACADWLHLTIMAVAQVTIHVHAAQEAGHITALTSLLDPKSGLVAKQRPRALLKGQSALVEVTPVQAICVELYSDFRALGRIVLRDGGQTLAVGIVTALTSA